MFNHLKGKNTHVSYINIATKLVEDGKLAHTVVLLEADKMTMGGNK